MKRNVIEDKRILIIYTGGTIGMVRGEHGYSPEHNALQEYLASGSRMISEELPDWDLIEFDPLLDSSDMKVEDWNKIGRTISDNYEKYDGFVILHGTDTMAYTASALSFMLEGLGKPVILTGSQIPLCELRSDGYDNILNSIMFAASDDIREVCLCFDGDLLRGNRAVKISAEHFKAFASPSYPALAECGIDIVYNRDALLRSTNRIFSLQELRPASIGVIKIFPGIQFRQFEPVMTEGIKALILETFGAGNIPGNGTDIMPLLKKAADTGCIVVVCSQCQKGRVSLGAYESSRALVENGAVNALDMTTEAAIAKLYYLLSKGLSTESIRKYMGEDLCGEITV